MATTQSITEADILAEVIAPTNADLSPNAAQSLLELRFDEATSRRIRRLLEKNNRGTITMTERDILQKYLRVGQLLDLLHAKARISLKHFESPR